MPRSIANTAEEIFEICEGSSTAAVAAACAMDNQVIPNQTHTEFSILCWLAESITKLMAQGDEPRFTLYDYLDAIINNRYTKWTELADEINKLVETNTDESLDAAYEKIIAIAAEKREVYSS